MASSAPLSKANTSFCLDLFKKLSDKDKAANVFYSPFSISSALAMVMLGARETAEDTQQGRCSVLPQCCQQTVRGAVLPVCRGFLGATRKHYDAELESVDFKTSHEAARLNINTWVEKQTQGKIQDVLAQGVVDKMTRLVLVNAIYFKGNWNKQFKERYTEDAQFRINKNESKPVKMMHQKTKFPYSFISEFNCQVLEIPYKGEELSMLIFLPMDIDDSSTGLEKLEKELTYENFVEWTRPDTMEKEEVQLGLPRFKMEEKYDMKDVLISMGMVDAFDMAMSDFSGMSPSDDLVLSKVVHKAFVEVNEVGTEAAAATAVVMMLGSSGMPPVRFIADHPFLFFIRHNPTSSVLFAGRFCSPQ
ncbi:leukocyte elastase inhibitor [Hippoglossus stenolepis]|uniref:leukocyte elastase inhibitor n=1 Tax=Hippoglossus stenolepis TaxID=195615 RepID=UPI001FAFDA85|nr:leukocyte elastase inhibitor [Hippoglossus stenolepis]